MTVTVVIVVVFLIAVALPENAMENVENIYKNHLLGLDKIINHDSDTFSHKTHRKRNNN